MEFLTNMIKTLLKPHQSKELIINMSSRQML